MPVPVVPHDSHKAHVSVSRLAKAAGAKSLGSSGSARNVKLKPAMSVKKRFARRFKLNLQVLAIDGGGNVTNVRRTISVR